MLALGSGDVSKTTLQGSGRRWRDVCVVQGVQADPIRHLHMSGLPFMPYT